MRFGSATPITLRSLMPSTSLKDVIFWSTIAFAFGGVESASTMAEEIRRRAPHGAARRCRGGGDHAALSRRHAQHPARDSAASRSPGLQGIMQAMQAMAARVGVGVAGADRRVPVTLNALGGVGGWFAATARLPFVAGIDRFLPRAFGRCTRRGGRRMSRCSCRRRFRRCSWCSARPGRRCAAPTTCSSA